jgi:hypothetical protein
MMERLLPRVLFRASGRVLAGLPLSDHMLSLLVATGLALLVWLYARSRDQEILDNVTLPVQISLPANQGDHYSLETTGVSQVVASFSGSPARIRELRGILQRNELSVSVVVTVPDERLTEGRYSDTVVVEAGDVHAPPGVTVLIADGRNRIPVTLHRLIARLLPVRLDYVGDNPAAAATAEIDPPTVMVRGPQELVERAAAVIKTTPTDLPVRPANALPFTPAVGRVNLLPELEGRSVHVEPSKVTVRVRASSRKVYELPEVPVHFLCPANFVLRPEYTGERAGRISLRIQGPVLEEAPKVFAFVDLTRGAYSTGLNHEPLQLQLPKDFQLMDEVPRVFGFLLERAEFIPKGLGQATP